MSLVDIDTWITEFDACERLSHDIQSHIVLRNREPRLSNEYSKISAGVRFKLKQFSTELQQLNKNLAEASSRGSITEQEAERRQRQIETLQSSLIHLQTQFTNAADKDMQRAELLGNGNRPSLWEEDDEDEAMADTRPSGSTINNKYSVQDYRKQQTKILDDQNEGLEALAKVISRQKHLALRIGDEVDEQNDIIGDLAVTMESTDSRTANETRNVNFALQNESTRGYWIIIISLFVAIVIVALL